MGMSGYDDYPSQEREPRRGDVVEGKIVALDSNGIWVGIGATKYDAFLPVEEMDEELQEKFRAGELSEGDPVQVVVLGTRKMENGMVYRVSQKELGKRSVLEKLMEAKRNNETIKVVPTEVDLDNQRLIVDFGYGVKGFIRASQADARYVTPDRLPRYVNRRMKVKVLRVNRRNATAELSAKAVYREEMEKRKKQFFEENSPGSIVRGRVVRVEDDGVIVELVRGLVGKIPLEELDWRPVSDPNRVVRRGDNIKVYIMDMNPDTEEITLSLRLAKPNPWEVFAKKHSIGDKVKGRVLKVDNRKLVVKVGDIIGIVPRSEMSWRKVFNPHDLFKRGDRIEAVIKEIDPEQQRLVLSVKEAQPDPWENVDPADYVGRVFEGVVTDVKDFGAFVDIGNGLEGLVRRSEISWLDFDDIHQVIKPGDKVKVKVLGMDIENRRITLSIRQTVKHPLDEYREQHPVGTVVEGEVEDVTDRYVVVKLTDVVKGVITRGNWSVEGISGSLMDVVKPGDKVKAKIIGYPSYGVCRQKYGLPFCVLLSRRALEEEKRREEYKEYVAEEPMGSYTLKDMLGAVKDEIIKKIKGEEGTEE